MKPRLLPIEEQVIVITGASSGIGLATAREAARAGAAVVMCARNSDALHAAASELEREGARADAIVADVARLEDVERVAMQALRRFGRIDTWVNNAGVTIYGRLADVPLADQRRLFDVNFWGVVHGSHVAVRHMGERGGALINVGSTLSERAVPLQGMYSATKHAVKGYTDALRMELERDDIPISVSLIKPGSIDTMYELHGKSYLHSRPQNPPPYYTPQVVARAILHCAEHPTRELYAGGGGKALAVLGRLAPRLTDRIMERTMFRAQHTGEPNTQREGNLDTPARDGDERSGTHSLVFRHSAYTALARRRRTVATAALLTAVLGGLYAARRRG
jgi:short-subunit dehydrogenase